MALPWLRLIDAALNVTDVVRHMRSRKDSATPERQTALGATASAIGGIEARLAGVVVSALKEAFDRDGQRMALEREKLEADRQRAERLLKLELLRQAGERELSRLRAVGAAAIVGLVAALIFVARASGSKGGKVMLGLSWALLLAGMVCTYLEQQRVTRAMAVADERLSVESATAPEAAGVAAPWLVAAGFAALGIAALL